MSRLHSATIRAVVAESTTRSSLRSFVPPKTQSFLRGIAYIERGIITNDGVWKIFDPRHNRDLAAVGLKIGIVDEFAGTDPGTVDHETKLLDLLLRVS